MRLEKSEQRSILAVLLRHAGGLDLEVYLYGSRVDDEKKGGDIDLLWVHPRATELRQSKFRILVELKEVLGDQRIDLTIVSTDELAHDAFLALASRTRVRLVAATPE